MPRDLSGALLGDVRHDPFQSGADLPTPAHERVEPGAVHRANKGVLYIDEIRMLRMEEQQALLVAMQRRPLPSAGGPSDHPVPSQNPSQFQRLHPGRRGEPRQHTADAPRTQE